MSLILYSSVLMRILFMSENLYHKGTLFLLSTKCYKVQFYYSLGAYLLDNTNKLCLKRHGLDLFRKRL